MDERTDGDSPLCSTGLRPIWVRCPASLDVTFKNEKQGMGTADHMKSLDYLLSSSLQVVIAVGMLRVPVLHHFPFLLAFSTITTFALSYLITLAGPVRYFFGLPTAEDAIFPGKALKGLIPGIVLAIVIIIETVVSNLM